MELILNHNPCWTERHVKFLQKYKQSYGVVISEIEYKNEVQNIVNGNASLRCLENQMCYEIYEEETYVGDITINECNEIDIIIFDEYSGNKYAYKAINLFVENYWTKEENLEAVIRKENEYKTKIQNVLKKVGFMYFYTSEEGNEVWIYK